MRQQSEEAAFRLGDGRTVQVPTCTPQCTHDAIQWRALAELSYETETADAEWVMPMAVGRAIGWVGSTGAGR